MLILLAYLNEVRSRGDDLSVVQDHSHDCVFRPVISLYQWIHTVKVQNPWKSNWDPLCLFVSSLVANKHHFVDGPLLYQFRMNFRRRRRLIELLHERGRTIPESHDSPFCLRKQNSDGGNTSFLSGRHCTTQTISYCVSIGVLSFKPDRKLWTETFWFVYEQEMKCFDNCVKQKL